MNTINTVQHEDILSNPWYHIIFKQKVVF